MRQRSVYGGLNMVDTLMAVLESDAPEAWFNAEFVEWLNTVRG